MTLLKHDIIPDITNHAVCHRCVSAMEPSPVSRERRGHRRRLVTAARNVACVAWPPPRETVSLV